MFVHKYFRSASVALCAVLVLCSPFRAEAKGGWDGIVKKILDPKATEAYIKEVQQLAELYEQGRKMQTQIEQLQQSLEHYNFKDLQQTYNFLNQSMDDFEKIQTNFAGMNVTISEMEDQWDELNPEYDPKTMTDDKRKELDEKRKKRHENSNKMTMKFLGSINDSEKLRESMQLVKNNLSLLESGKASPVKATQALGQLTVQLLNEMKRTQKINEEELRRALEKDQTEKDKAKQKKAEGQHESDEAKEQIENFASDKKGTVFDGIVPSSEEELKNAIAVSNRNEDR